MATIKNEFDYIQEARSQLAEALVNKFGVREQDILNADGSIKSTGLWASNSDGSKNYLKRLHDWAVLITATNVHTDASLTFKDNGKGDEVGTTFNGSVAKSISYNSIGAAPAGHTHRVQINGTTKNITALGGPVVDLGSYLPLTGGTMTGAINFYNTNAKLAFGSLTQSPITGYEAPYWSTNGVGIYSRYEDGSNEGAIIITEDTCVIYNSADTGWNFQVMDTDLGKDMSNDATRSFGVN